MSTAGNQFQIIGGRHRGRKFKFLEVTSLRPTPNKVRETLFNWIQFELSGKVFLDLFSGSGALSFEALSRGARQVFSIEKDLRAFQQLEKNRTLLNTGQIQFIHADALDFLTKNATQPFDFILLDPPFHQKILEKSLTLLSKNGFLTSGCQLYLESEFKITDSLLTNHLSQPFSIHKQKHSGQVHYCLIKVL